MKDKVSEILKSIGVFIAVLVLFLAWSVLSLVASFLQAIDAATDPSVCAKDYYIEYILFTDMFCEVSK